MKTITKSDTQHTPGPWYVGTKGSRHFIDGADELTVAYLDRAGVRERLTIEANAQLIAAAPDMLEALRAIVAALSQPAQRADVTDADRSRLAGMVNILRGDATFAVNAAQSAIARAEVSR